MSRYSLLLVLMLGQMGSAADGQTRPASSQAGSGGQQSSLKRKPIDLALAAKYFREARTLADRDGGKLWGKSLAGPMLFVDPASRFVAANQADAEGKLKPEGSVFVGTLPAGTPLANTAVRWAGTHWSMLLWPPPTDAAERTTMLMHESWHRIQADLGLPLTDPLNAHLDTLEGRYWMQLEWRALTRALGTSGEKQRQAIEDALRFRAHRRGLFPGSAAKESQLERNEGLAEYTGITLNGSPAAEQRRLLMKHLESYPTFLGTFVRSFAYLSGPSYGLLLDQHAPGWRTNLKSGGDLGDLLAGALSLKLEAEPETALKERAGRYEGDKLRSSEVEREETRRRKVEAFRKVLIDGPVLRLPLGKQQMSFNPSVLVPIEGVGTVYPTLTLISDWGKLEVHKAALITSDFRKAYVGAPTKTSEKSLSGDGWELELAAGWKATEGERKGDWKLVREK
jgi:hypothetical protein